MVTFALIRMKAEPVHGGSFEAIPRYAYPFDAKLIAGSFIFGLGVSFSGLWPGIFGSMFSSFQAIVFLLSFMGGMCFE